jgi:phosphopentomutase
MDLQRVIVIVLDGVGAGETPDAGEYGDVGSNSLSNTAQAVGGLVLPNMGEIGLGNITDIKGVPRRVDTLGAYGTMLPKSAGKDSITGHWELMGVYMPKPLPLYPDGFPPEVIDAFIWRSGRGVLGNRAASGTEIIKELGEEHMRTGKLIVYTSGDSVFQIAANEAIVPIPELYRYCEIAREMLTGEHAVGRVIARPFVGNHPADFVRTERRHDYPLQPVAATMMDKLIESGRSVFATGKIDDLFANRGISETHHTVDNMESTQGLICFLKQEFSGLLFSNLIEFDMIYGHRNDPIGFADKLEEFDRRIPDIRSAMHPTDIAMIVADHGVDPTTPSTDHSRECIPLLVFGARVKENVDLGRRTSFSDVAATLAEVFHLDPPEIGESFLKEVLF